MSLSEHDAVIQALPSDRADQPLDIRLLPGTLEGGDHFFDAHRLYSLTEILPIDLVPVSDQIARCCVLRERLHNLLRCPAGTRMFSHIEVHDSSAIIREYYQYKQHAERGSWNGEEVNCD